MIGRVTQGLVSTPHVRDRNERVINERGLIPAKERFFEFYVGLQEPAAIQEQQAEPVEAYRPWPCPEVADWVKPEHKTPFLLCESLYSSPLKYKNDYTLVPELTSERVGVWQNSANGYFIGCRGTTFLTSTSHLDWWDDIKIAMSKSASTDVSLVAEASRVVTTLVQNGATDIMIGGHSLGGFSAFGVAAKFGLKACSFNGAAPMTNPVVSGPGRQQATHYHIVGDLVSTHMGCEAADVVRVDKKKTFGFVEPHATDRFYAKDPTTRISDATDEDTALMVWAATNPPDALSHAFRLAVGASPIPCSARAKDPLYQAAVQIGGVVEIIGMSAPGGHNSIPRLISATEWFQAAGSTVAEAEEASLALAGAVESGSAAVVVEEGTALASFFSELGELLAIGAEILEFAIFL